MEKIDLNLYGNKEIKTILKLLINLYQNKTNETNYIKLNDKYSKLEKQTKKSPFIYCSCNKLENNSEIYIGTSEFTIVSNINKNIKNIDLDLILNLLNSNIPRKKGEIKLLINGNINYINHLKNLNLLNGNEINYKIIYDNVELKNRIIENKNYIGIIPNIFYLDYKKYFNKINLLNDNLNILSYNLYFYSNIQKFEDQKLLKFLDFLNEKKNISNIILKLGYIIKESNIETTKKNDNIKVNSSIESGINVIDNILNEFDYSNDLKNEDKILYENIFNNSQNLNFYLNKIQFYSYYIKLTICLIENGNKYENCYILEKIDQIKDTTLQFIIENKYIIKLPLYFEKNKENIIYFKKYNYNKFNYINLKTNCDLIFINSIWRKNINNKTKFITIYSDKYIRNNYYNL